MRRPFYFLIGLGLLGATSPALAQQAPSPAAAPLECQQLTGTVTDDKQQPLTGATVVVPGLNDAFSTNSQGQYIVTLKKPLTRPVQLHISAAGYETQKLTLNSCQVPAVQLRTLPGTRFKRDGRIKKTTSTGKIRY